MKKFLKWTAIVLAVLVVAPLAVVIAINAFDESLTPQAASYGEPRAPAVPAQENGYYAMIALSAPDGADGIPYARAWVDEARAAASANRPEKHPDVKRAKRPVTCDAAQTSCLAVARAGPDEVKAQLDAYQEDLARYEALIAYKRYEEVLDYPLRLTTPLPNYGALAAAHRAYVLRAALAAERGNVEGAIAAIERDLAFQRAMLTGARTLLGKLVSRANYWRDLAFISDLVHARAADVRLHLPRLRDMLKSPDFTAAGMGAVVESEFAYRKPLLRNPHADGGAASMGLGKVEDVVTRVLYKPNATLNDEVRFLAALTAALNLPPNQGSEALTRLVRPEVEMTVWNYVDNPVGNILRRVAMPDFTGDAYGHLRLHDAHAYTRLVALQVELLAANVEADRVAAFVSASDARFHDPYTGKPMVWDAASKQLSFQAQSRTTQLRKLFNTDKGRVFVQL
jgi:hypothetical protein